MEDSVGRRSSKPLVSVVIPTRNRARPLHEALRSVYAQEGIGDQFRMEVIVVDNASTDDTPEVVRQFSRVRYIRLPMNQGGAAARNVGVKASKGTWVAFLDDDDVWLPHNLRLQIAALAARPEAEVVYGQCIFRFLDYERVQPDARHAPVGSVFGPLLMHNFVSSPSAIIARRRALEAAGYFDESLASGEDYDMLLRLALRVRFEFVDGPVVIYRRIPAGKYSLYLVRTGGGSLRRVVEKALAMLPDTAQYKDLKRAALASVEVRIAADLEDIRRAGSTRPRAWAGPRLWTRRLTAERWLRVASILGTGLWNDPEALPRLPATDRVVLYDPGKLGKKVLLWLLLLASGILRRRNRRVASALSQTASGWDRV